MNKTIQLRKNEKVNSVYVNGLRQLRTDDYTINKDKLTIGYTSKKDLITLKTIRNIQL